MNKYYYCKAANISCCFIFISNDENFILGKILKIDFQVGNLKVGENLYCPPTLCEIITDLDLINELDKLMVFQ